MNLTKYLLVIIVFYMIPFTGHSSIRIDHVTIIDVINNRILYDQEIFIENGKILAFKVFRKFVFDWGLHSAHIKYNFYNEYN